MASEEKPRSTVLKRILYKPGDAIDDDALEPIRDARLAVPTPMLDLVMRDGSVESFGYAYLSRVTFDPRGRLVLYFGEDVVVIEGRNLADIRQKVRRHKVSGIYEGIEAEEALKPESATYVDRIYMSSVKEEEKHNDARHGNGITRQ
jgi:hypothetical protein